MTPASSEIGRKTRRPRRRRQLDFLGAEKSTDRLDKKSEKGMAAAINDVQ